ncbi:MAG: GGDEF domain-containing protein [Phycisphaerales bacterium]|nr:GGDEF domain-containing protein [Phycisphaerales bacterium]
MSSISSQSNRPSKVNRRVILVGRTGLDQVLRRDESIELIRAKDSIDAIGELSDPIDTSSPVQAVVLVAASSEPSDDELCAFISSLRMIDHNVCILRVGANRQAYDGSVDPDSKLDQIILAFEHAEQLNQDEQGFELRFVGGDDSVGIPTDSVAQIEEINEEQVILRDHVEQLSDVHPKIEEPEVVVVARNESFEHRSQVSFEDESEIHRDVLTGATKDSSSGLASNETQQTPISQHHIAINGPHDDQPLVEAMLSGRSVIDAAMDRIKLRLGRDDVSFSKDTQSSGLPVMLGDQLVGKIVCEDQRWVMGDGHSILQHQATWLTKWIKLELQQAELRNSAFTDSLTGAWNRRYFTRFLDAAIAQSRSVRQPLSLMLFDIDGFKHYNDTYGHAAGDQILIETVKLLKSVIRPSDRVCRVGGDEFVVIFYEPSGPRDPESKPLESVFQIATRFQKQICTHRFPKLAGDAMGTLTVSAGLASFPWDGHDADSLLEQADMLAMESKRQGKNAITLGPGAETVCKIPENE